MAFLTDADRARIEQAVEAAETKTSGEFMAVIAEESDDYLYIPTLVAAGLVLVVSGLALLVWPPTLGVGAFYAGQVVAFIALSLVFRWTPLKMALIPPAVRRQRASGLAHQMFLDLGLTTTQKRTGVMLFVSAAEHYVEIIADRGVQQALDNAVWERIVSEFIAEVKAGCAADGCVAAIDACAEVMAEHHPWRPDDENELPNRLVEI